ncbi:unnamed protein product [Tetraodon nigroviridis]|uniref:Chromosome undetermined SCAF13832, whole genome shotgun sequence n=1 Tax=Tetraodon nigroviridis TaxID=99883 RepID=Q4SV05_TETNG|nr:unnamed protein product [Tetraodon nigroviridis]
MAAQIRSLVSAQWLADAIKNNLVGPKLRVLDTSWYLPKTKRDPKAEFVQKHIPGSSFFDIDECSDRSSALDHMLPSPELFSRYVGALGIGNDTHVVVYDTSDFGSYSAPRVLVDVPPVRPQPGVGAGRGLAELAGRRLRRLLGPLQAGQRRVLGEPPAGLGAQLRGRVREQPHGAGPGGGCQVSGALPGHGAGAQRGHAPGSLPWGHQHALHLLPGPLWEGAGRGGPEPALPGGRGGPEQTPLGHLRVGRHRLPRGPGRPPAGPPRGVCLRRLLVRVVQESVSRPDHHRGREKEGVDGENGKIGIGLVLL